MREIPSVAERPGGKIPTTNVTNEHARAIQAMAPMLGGGQQPGHWSGPGFDVWLVWDAGPNGEVDKTNHQYWLRQAFVANTKPDPPAEGAPTPAPFAHEPAKFQEITVEPKYETWILATNITERPATFEGTHGEGWHGLVKGQAVGPIWTEHDAADPSITRYVFSCCVGNDVQVKIIGDAEGDGTYKGIIGRQWQRSDAHPAFDSATASGSVDLFDYQYLPEGETFNCYYHNKAEKGQNTHALTEPGRNTDEHRGTLMSRLSVDGYFVVINTTYATETCAEPGDDAMVDAFGF